VNFLQRFFVVVACDAGVRPGRRRRCRLVAGHQGRRPAVKRPRGRPTGQLALRRPDSDVFDPSYVRRLREVCETAVQTILNRQAVMASRTPTSSDGVRTPAAHDCRSHDDDRSRRARGPPLQGESAFADVSWPASVNIVHCGQSSSIVNIHGWSSVAIFRRNRAMRSSNCSASCSGGTPLDSAPVLTRVSSS
jgi:hypothetical protein